MKRRYWAMMMTGEKLTENELFTLLEERADFYNRKAFIEPDPISIPHRFSRPADIEIAAFLTATIAWGQRRTIIKNANSLMERMDNAPADFIRSFGPTDLKPFEQFVHRTFNGQDCLFFLRALQHLINKYHSLENAFLPVQAKRTEETLLYNNIMIFRERFLGESAPVHVGKHISNPARGAAAKRLNMFLRWMVRKDKRGVDFGIWRQLNMSQLMIPLDVHSGRVARQLQLLQRKQDDWLAVVELTERLKQFDPNDPVKYDFALFGMGVNAAS